jgi:hypothetical protein
MHQIIMTVVAGTALLTGVVRSAAAQGVEAHHAAVTIANPGAALVTTYSLHWGNGPWRSYRLGPGQSMLHTWPYSHADQGRSPSPQIQFDYTLNDDQYMERSYRLVAYAVAGRDGRGSHEYAFSHTIDDADLDLIPTN